MRLTEPGLYVARDGRVAISQTLPCETGEVLSVCIFEAGFGKHFWTTQNNSDTEGEWERIDLDAVKWPELPPKPLLVLILGEDYGAPRWRSIYYIEELSKQHLKRGYYKVVPHPDNDPEAVAMIEAARKEANDA